MIPYDENNIPEWARSMREPNQTFSSLKDFTKHIKKNPDFAQKLFDANMTHNVSGGYRVSHAGPIFSDEETRKYGVESYGDDSRKQRGLIDDYTRHFGEAPPEGFFGNIGRPGQMPFGRNPGDLSIPFRQRGPEWGDKPGDYSKGELYAPRPGYPTNSLANAAQPQPYTPSVPHYADGGMVSGMPQQFMGPGMIPGNDLSNAAQSYGQMQQPYGVANNNPSPILSPGSSQVPQLPPTGAIEQYNPPPSGEEGARTSLGGSAGGGASPHYAKGGFIETVMARLPNLQIKRNYASGGTYSHAPRTMDELAKLLEQYYNENPEEEEEEGEELYRGMPHYAKGGKTNGMSALDPAGRWMVEQKAKDPNWVYDRATAPAWVNKRTDPERNRKILENANKTPWFGTAMNVAVPLATGLIGGNIGAELGGGLGKTIGTGVGTGVGTYAGTKDPLLSLGVGAGAALGNHLLNGSDMPTSTTPEVPAGGETGGTPGKSKLDQALDFGMKYGLPLTAAAGILFGKDEESKLNKMGLGGGKVFGPEQQYRPTKPIDREMNTVPNEPDEYGRTVNYFKDSNPRVQFAAQGGRMSNGLSKFQRTITSREPMQMPPWRSDQQYRPTLPLVLKRLPVPNEVPYGAPTERYFEDANPPTRYADEERQMAKGGKTHGRSGLNEYVARGGYLDGDTGGQDDKLKAMLSDGEYVISADVVSNLGDGNNKAGAKKLDGLMSNVRKHKYAKAAKTGKLPPKAKSLESYMRSR